MISYIRGNILHKGSNYVIVENGGIGYKVLVTPEVLEKNATTVELYTYLKISDDGQTLFGLPDLKTLEFFELLITVSGVGPKMALTILSAAKIDVLEEAIANGDADIFIRMSGVGRKTAERIILELKTKVGTLSTTTSGGSDIYDALIQLGYSAKEAREAIGKVDRSTPNEQQLKHALKLLAK